MKNSVIISSLASALLLTASASFAAVSTTVALTQTDSTLTAHILVTQDQEARGTLLVDWIAPANSGCKSSQYPLSYNYKRYHTWATRNIVVNSKTCTGKWIVNVLDDQKNQLATASYEVTSAANADAITPTGMEQTVPALKLRKPDDKEKLNQSTTATSITSQPTTPIMKLTPAKTTSNDTTKQQTTSSQTSN